MGWNLRFCQKTHLSASQQLKESTKQNTPHVRIVLRGCDAAAIPSNDWELDARPKDAPARGRWHL
jgi:hypothetical protein